jgi:hypothetical protein
VLTSCVISHLKSIKETDIQSVPDGRERDVAGISARRSRAGDESGGGEAVHGPGRN